MGHTDDFFADAQGKGSITYKPSSHRFTDPIRLFKANDPYYWEVDNIPLQQLQESMLWLKDQVGTVESVNLLGRDKFSELKPVATGDSRVVTVNPGRFTGRVNDAYNTGISTIVLKAIGNISTDLLNSIEIVTPDLTFMSLAGAITSKILGDNGLYDFVQHNVTAPGALYNTQWTSNYTSFIQNKQDSMGAAYDLQHIKLALWKQGTTVKNYGTDPLTHVDLQQLAVEFTRAYGAPFRTSVVDVPNALSITVPPFDDADYTSGTSYVPAIRVDLLFVYTKPIDAVSTAILKPVGGGVSKLMTPQLGLVKGAGVIALNGKGAWTGAPLDVNFFADKAWTYGKDYGSNYFDSSGGFDSDSNMQIASILSDLNQTSIGVNNVFANFPSPDDLLNAAPYIVNGVSKTSLQLVGQSVLPLAYVFTKKSKGIIETEDIFDIRPFFRTAELTYNERAGLAAANPPTSLANPVVSNYQLADTASKLRDYVIGNIPEVPQYPRPVGTGYVFGGIKYGPEGVLARLASDESVVNNKLGDISKPGITKYLTDTIGALPVIPGQSVPEYPDWDTPAWAAAKVTDPGLLRNDKFHQYYNTSDRETYALTQDAAFNTEYGAGHVDYPAWISSSYGTRTGYQSLLVRKRIDLVKSQVNSWMVDYDVRLSYINCVPAASDPKYINVSDEDDQSIWMQPHGLYVEKHDDHFNIVACWVNGDSYGGTEDTGPGGFGSRTTQGSPSMHRTNTQWSRIMVTSENGMLTQQYAKRTAAFGNIGNAANAMFRGEWCTYPSVHFEVIGYPEEYVNRIKMNSGISSVLKLVT